MPLSIIQNGQSGLSTRNALNTMFAEAYGNKLAVQPPAGFDWDFVNYPVNVYRDGPRHFAVDTDLKSRLPASLWNGKVYYVDPINGSNSNSGLTAALPFKSQWKAWRTAEADATVASSIILVMCDRMQPKTFVSRNEDFNDTAGGGGTAGSSPTKPFALIATGGRLVNGPMADGTLSWTDDGSGTGTYATSRTGVGDCIDITYHNSFGINQRLTKAASQAACQSTPGSFYYSTPNLYVHMMDGKAPTYSRLKVLLTAGAFNPGSVPFYTSNVEFWGSASPTDGGTVGATTASSRNFLMENGGSFFSGATGSGALNGVAVDKLSGLGMFRNWKCGGSTADHFNTHQTAGQGYVLYVDCEGVDAGMAGSSPQSLSNQNFTAHENARILNINPKGSFSAGGNMRNIGTSKEWNLGADLSNDRGDVALGGSITSINVKLDDSAEIWMDSPKVYGSMNTFGASGTAKIHLYDPIEAGIRVAGAGTIDSYTA